MSAASPLRKTNGQTDGDCGQQGSRNTRSTASSFNACQLRSLAAGPVSSVCMHHLMRAIAATADSDDDDNDVWSYTTGPLFKHSNVRKVNKVLEHMLVV